MRNRKLLLALAICLLLNSFAFSQASEERLDSLKTELRKSIEKKMKAQKVVGLSIALVDNQETVWAEGFGFADREKQVKATPQTIYIIASISKLFTATSVMQLADAGKINIDNDIKTYIPEFKIKSRFKNPGTITPRTLMTHYAGLPSDLPYKMGTPNGYPFTSVVDLLNEEYTCTQPNTIWSYSNVGASLLGVLVEKTSGENFFDYTQKHLFQQMDMKSSSFRLEGEMEKLFSKSYSNGKEFERNIMRDIPAGGIHSNALDMANFIKMTFNNGNYNGKQILKAETLSEMQTIQNNDCKFDFSNTIGLNWGVNSNAWGYAGKLATHAGNSNAFISELKTLTEHKIGVIVMSNTDNSINTVTSVTTEILKKYLELKKGIKAPVNVKTEAPNMDNCNTSLQSIAGEYFLESLGFVSFKAKGNKLNAKTAMGKLVLSPTGRGTFTPKIKKAGLFSKKINMELMFKKIDSLDIILLVSKQRLFFEGSKILKPVLTDVWKNRLGNYININEDLKYCAISSLEIMEKDGYLFIKFADNEGNKETLVIKPVSENQAVVDGMGRNTGNTLTFNGDEIYAGGVKMKKIIEKK